MSVTSVTTFKLQNSAIITKFLFHVLKYIIIELLTDLVRLY